MTYTLLKESAITHAEFILLEQDNPDKRYEFHDGKVWEMEATTIRHNRIVRNIANALDSFYVPTGCVVVTENVRLAFAHNRYGYYPDVNVSFE